MDLHLTIKILTGIIIVPLAILAHQAWPLWTKSPIAVRVLSGPIILPVTGLAAVLTPWWEKI